ncbi:metal-sensing transcriptional repressor [Bordetella genomosp. 13]|uniref:metal-sensing transcriptional repressor n=1 Tax=Bordetella genomosp. 13 TaxID=463040 RepID=UPI0011AA6889|nr:metal-sensing transcriptional repressor [Bordetella genomosp. 13]
MPHSPEDKKRAITRLRRIQGQATALERAVEEGTDCRALLQQIAALRGAANGLMAEVLDSHLRELFGTASGASGGHHHAHAEADIDDLMKLLRTYLK